MQSTVRRAGAFALVGTVALAAPLLGRAAAIPFAMIALFAVAVSGGPLFELFARPGDREEGRLRGLFGFALSAAVLAALAAFGSLPTAVFAGTVLLVAVGNLGAELARGRTATIVGYLAGALAGGTIGQFGVVVLAGLGQPSVVEIVTLSVTGALLAALVRSMLFPRDEPPLVFSVGLLLWLLAAVGVDASFGAVGLAFAITAGFGVASYLLDTASIEGMVAGILLGFLTIVLGGYGWFALLIAFFAIGGLATKFRYERKLEHGVAQDDGGARGGENVLANSGAALAAVLAYALADAALVAGDPMLYFFVFAGAVATALSDTLSSEIGGAFGGTRLITTFEPVPAGTDGGVTWQGGLAGLFGATIVAALALVLFSAVGTLEVAVVVVAGVVGMTADSLLGATVEGDLLGNEGVNFLATLSGGLVAAVLALFLGLVTLPPLPVIVT